MNLSSNQIASDCTLGPTLRGERAHHANTIDKQGRGFFKPRPCTGFDRRLPLMQHKVRCACHRSCRHDSLKFGPLFQSFHGAWVAALLSGQKLDCQTLAAFGTACVDHSATTACFHTNQKAVCTGAASFRWLISAFHDFSKKLSPEETGKPMIISNF